MKMGIYEYFILKTLFSVTPYRCYHKSLCWFVRVDFVYLLLLMLATLPDSPVRPGGLYVDCFGSSLFSTTCSVDNDGFFPFPVRLCLYFLLYCSNSGLPCSVECERWLVCFLRWREAFDVSVLSMTSAGFVHIRVLCHIKEIPCYIFANNFIN